MIIGAVWTLDLRMSIPVRYHYAVQVAVGGTEEDQGDHRYANQPRQEEPHLDPEQCKIQPLFSLRQLTIFRIIWIRSHNVLIDILKKRSYVTTF